VRLRGMLIAPLLLWPAAVSARDIAACADLYRQLNNAPQVIGNTGEMRQYAQALGQTSGDIRNLRIQMRQIGCGGGSIVVIGGSNAAECDQMRQSLETLEAQRASLSEQRNNSRQLVRSADNRTPILAALRQNSCIPTDLEEQQHLDEQERLKVQGLALPKDEGHSSITDLRGAKTPPAQTAIAAPPPQPDRAYDPNKKVRMVGPRFLPESGIDLANPKSGGSPQPQQ
jgi:hypothetical protein